MKIFVVIAMLCAIIGLGYYNYTANSAAAAAAIAANDHVPFTPFVASKPSVAKAIGAKCDGRTHCSHMNSCAEAKYFIQNCPNTKMDGDSDGIPCEKQWC